MLDGFICDTCGFTSSEEVGTGNTYYCPKCGNKMRRASHGGMFGGGDANTSSSVLAWDLMYLIFIGGLSFGVINYIGYWTNDFVDWMLIIIWVLLFLVSFRAFHRWISGSVSNKAIKKNQNSNPMRTRTIVSNNNVNKSFYCTNCGQKLQKDVKFCPNCGTGVER